MTHDQLLNSQVNLIIIKDDTITLTWENQYKTVVYLSMILFIYFFVHWVCFFLNLQCRSYVNIWLSAC